FYNYWKLMQKEECRAVRKKQNWNGSCGLVVEIWTPFDIDYFPVFQLVVLYSLIAGYLLMRVPVHLALLILEIVQHIILRMNHLKSMIIDCFQQKTISEEQFQKCILYHTEI